MKGPTMRFSPLVLLLASGLLLASCGGGGGSSGGVVPTGGGTTPTPVPTATPTPVPGTTPVPTVSATPAPAATTAVVQGSGTALSGSVTFSGGWTPYAIASSLDFPVQHGWNGSGQTVGIVIDSDVSRTVVNAYLSQFGITRSGTLVTKSVDGSTGIPSAGASAGDQDEAYLDVETIAALAPGANIIIYQINDLKDSSIAKAYAMLNSDGIANVANSSFGGCEASGLPEDPYIQAGAQAGIMYVASGGDSGNVCDGVKMVGASWPGSNPNATSAGGTETNVSKGYNLTSNRVWNDNSCAGTPSQCGGGGGISSIYSLPTYQSGLQGIASSTKRNTPDISLPAEDDATYTGSWALVNGTSWAAPEYAALMAEVYQYCNQSKGIPNPTSIPYYVDSTYQQAYIDVVSGNDQFQGTSPYYIAGAGYDDASGIGVPYGMSFANTACPGRTKAAALLRPAVSTMSLQTRSAGSFMMDVTPHESVADQGRRSSIAMTNVQIVMPSNANRTAVETALQRAGFTIDRRFSYDAMVNAVAPSGAVERFFGTQMHDVTQSRYGLRYMPVTQVTVPASIAPYVTTVNMDDLITRRVL